MSKFQIIPSLQTLSNHYYKAQLDKDFPSSRFLKSSLKEVTKSSGLPNLGDFLDQVEKAPEIPPQSGADVPSNVTQDIYQNIEALLFLHSYINTVSIGLMYERRPQGWNITDPRQAADFTRTFADSAFRVITQGLTGILNINTSISSNVNESKTLAEAHDLMLDKMFGSFGFSDSTMKQLDGMLTATVQRLKSLSIEFSNQSETLDFAVLFFYFEEILGTNYKVPYMRLFYLNIDQESWKASIRIGKNTASLEKFQLKMY